MGASRSSTLPGMLLLQGPVGKIESWLRRGTVPSYLVPVSGWSAVVPAGPSLAAPPYDDGLSVFAARPVPPALRTGIGLYAHADHAAVVLHEGGSRAPARWVVWLPERGATVLPGHQPATARDLLRAAGLVAAERDAVAACLRQRGLTPEDLLAELIDTLGLPGGSLLAGRGVPLSDGARLLTPGEAQVDRFNRIVAEENEMRAELEAQE